jgi:hypothetical protein
MKKSPPLYRDLSAFAECDIVIALQKDIHTRVSLSLALPLRRIPLTIQFSSSGNARLTTRKYRATNYPLLLLIFAITRKLCVVKAASESFGDGNLTQTSVPLLLYSLGSLAGKKTADRRTAATKNRSARFHLDLRMPDVRNFLSAA